MMHLDSRLDIKRGHRGHFFDPDTMRSFRSRLCEKIINHRYFVTSERQGDEYPRLYTIRQLNNEGDVINASEEGQYTSAEQAYTAAHKLPTD